MPVQPISSNKNLNGKMISPLIDFNFILNTDFGLIKYIQENYQDDRAFKLDILNKSDREILSLLYRRKDVNPLSIISTEDNMNDIDELYKSFFDNYKKQIIKVSGISKKIAEFVYMIGKNGNNLGISPYIAVSDDIEKTEISHYYKGFGFVNLFDTNAILSKDPYYIKDYTFFTKSKLEEKIHFKKIYMLPLQYSLDYFEAVDNNLTSGNVYVLMGNDYRKMEENNNGNQQQ